MATKEEKLALFFAKKDKKIKEDGYKTVNDIADKKYKDILAAKQSRMNRASNLEKQENQSDDEWTPLEKLAPDAEIIGLPSYKDQQIVEMIRKKKEEQQLKQEKISNLAPISQNEKSQLALNQGSNKRDPKKIAYKPGDLSAIRKGKTKEGKFDFGNDEEYPSFN